MFTYKNYFSQVQFWFYQNSGYSWWTSLKAILLRVSNSHHLVGLEILRPTYWHTVERSRTNVQNATNHSVWPQLWRDTCSLTLERCCTNVNSATKHLVELDILKPTFWHTVERNYTNVTSAANHSVKKTHLRTHILSQTGEKLHSCSKCNKSFSRAVALREHLFIMQLFS